MEDLVEGVAPLLHAHEPQVEVDGRVADGVEVLRALDAYLDVGAGGPGGDPPVEQRLPEGPVAAGRAEHLDDDSSRALGEVRGARSAQQSAAVEHDDAVSGALELAEQVARHDDGDAEVGVDPGDQVEHVVAGPGVEPARRLVEEDERRVVDEGLGELGPLLHAG